jgi:hypothetical protein
MTRPWEVRWFVPGDLDAELHPKARHVGRTDVYQLESLGPSSSLKLRNGDGPLERKTRVGPAEQCEIGGVPGLAERWRKQRVHKREVQRFLGPWIEVGKEVWRLGDVEICRLDVGGEPWWTIAARVSGSGASKSTAKVIASCRELLVAIGQPLSYPMWLLDRWDPQSDNSRSSSNARAR